MSGFNIAEVFTESLRFLAKHLRAVLILALLPYGLLFAAELMVEYVLIAPTPAPEWPNEPFMLDGLTLFFPESGVSYDLSPIVLQILVAFLLNTIVPLPFKVAWLRYALLGPQHQPVRIGYGFGNREIRFLGYTIALYLIMFAGATAVAAVAGFAGGAMQSNGIVIALTLAGMAFLFWLLARLFFVFPPLAMDLPAGFARAWAESRGQAFKLILVTAMISVLFLIPAFAVGQLFVDTPMAALVIGLVIAVVMDAALWTALGFAYWKTTGIPGPGGAQATQLTA